MKRTIIVATILALIVVGALATVAMAQGPFRGGMMGGGMMGRGGMMGGYGIAPNQGITSTIPYGYGPMMGGYGAPGQTISPTLPYGYGGMMGRGGMMGGYGITPGQGITSTVPYGCGSMMGGYGTPSTTSLTLDQAVTQFQNYVSTLNNPDLKLAEVEEYSWNFYGVVMEKSTGTNAFQLLLSKSNGVVYPEMGPNMMWNTKYSPMLRMMGGYGFNLPTGKMTVTVDQARTNATQFLKANLPGTTLETATDTYYGYYNIDVLKDGKTYGMLSVNGYTGVVWYHTWHGDFIQAKELD